LYFIAILLILREACFQMFPKEIPQVAPGLVRILKYVLNTSGQKVLLTLAELKVLS
jgi:hypothetical protein